MCGSSLATASTMGRVALPELRRYRYSPRLATGTLAAGGVLGILIPPSVVLVVYGIVVEASIVTLFMAAFIPGLIAVLFFILTIAIYVRLFPGSGPAGEAVERRVGYLSTGDQASSYEGRLFGLLPTTAWSDSYVTPVGSRGTGGFRNRVFLYNPSSSAISVAIRPVPQDRDHPAPPCP